MGFIVATQKSKYNETFIRNATVDVELKLYLPANHLELRVAMKQSEISFTKRTYPVTQKMSLIGLLRDMV